MKNNPVSIFIDGDEFHSFKELEIHQEYSNHHHFTVVQPLEDGNINNSLQISYGYIGKKISVKITENIFKTNQELTFIGLITDAVLVRDNGSFGEIHIKGYSPTIKMDSAKHSVSYTEKTFKDITQQICLDYNGTKELNPKFNVKKDKSLPYTVQYNESDFKFLKRFSQKKGQWFFYDGEQLYFGKPNGKDITLTYGELLKNFNLEMRSRPNQFEFIGYESSTASTESFSSSSLQPDVSGVNKIVFDKSKEIFPAFHNKQYANFIEEGNASSHLHDRAEQEVNASASKMIVLKGISEELGVKIGATVTVKDNAFSATHEQSKQNSQDYGSYVVTKVVHKYERSGQYLNHFEAVPESCVVPPNSDVFAIGKAEIQPGEVVENDDPMGLGRIKVMLPWQKSNGENTPWIRLVNPHAGGSKGVYFIPEIGEEVLVGFENNNPEKPFVFGTMYNGNDKSNYHTPGNDKKVIQTRSGTKMIMNDAEGSIFIEDPSGNTWLMDGKGNIKINAPKNMTITVGENLDITVGNNMTTSVGKNKAVTVGENNTENVGNNNTIVVTQNHKFLSKNYSQTVEENKNVIINGDLSETTASTTHKAKSGDILIQSAGISKILGAVDAKVNKG